MRYFSEIFWRHSLNVCRLFPNHSEFLVSLLVYQLAHFLIEIRLIQGYLQLWMRYISEVFWRHSWDGCSLFPNNNNVFVCLSVCYLAYFGTEYRQIQRYLLSRMRYLSEIVLRHSCVVLHYLTHIYLGFLCVSVCPPPPKKSVKN